MSTKILAVCADERELTLYLESGEAVYIKQGDSSIKDIADFVVPALQAKQTITMDDVNALRKKVESHYAEVEAKSNGLVRMFRIGKAKLKELFTGHKEREVIIQPIGLVGDLHPPKPVEVVETDTPKLSEAEEYVADIDRSPAKGLEIVQDIIAHAEPVAAITQATKEGETVVAIVKDVIIPGVEKLSAHLQGVIAGLGSIEGITRFFERVASMQRAHSVDDLLSFMAKGELVIADDGCIIAYKLLKGKNGKYWDCHSSTVPQRVGSHVFMDDSLVDANRYKDCSNGLHIAQRSYLKSFGGDVCVLVKLAPEDVIAVPHKDPSKVRARGYHIIAELSDDDRRLVMQNKPMEDTVLLGNAKTGNHIGIIETVQIMNQKRDETSIVVTVIGEATEVVLNTEHKTESLDTVVSEGVVKQHVDAVDLAKSVVKPVVKTEPKKTVMQSLLETFDTAQNAEVKRNAALALIAHLKNTRKSWKALGVSVGVHTAITEAAKAPVSSVTSKKPAVKAKPEKVATKGKSKTTKEQIETLLSKKLTIQVAKDIYLLKKQSKKGWNALGISKALGENITTLAKD